MDREAQILQERIEIAPLERHWEKPLERVRGEQDKQQEGDGDTGLHAQHQRPQSLRNSLAKSRDRRARECQDQHPEQHRTFVIAPGAAELEQHRHQRMRILKDIAHREIRSQISSSQ